MTQHYWNDEWFEANGADLYKAIDYFEMFNRRYGRWYFFTKEKYGTMRLEAFWFRTHLDNLLGKNLIYIRYPRLHRLSTLLDKVVRFIRLDKIIIHWQRFIFNIATLRTCKKWSNVVEEITDEYCFNTLLYSWTKKKINYSCKWVTYTSTMES
jgi:hypothetical protein